MISWRREVLVVAGIAALYAIAAISVRAQEVPKEIAAPSGQQIVLRAHAKGDQIYTCKEDVSGYMWVLKAPDAQLFDKDGKVLGKHFAGPSWELSDGSRVRGDAAAKVDSPDKSAIPWLLVNVVSHEGQGLLSPVTTIQRLNTKGGKAPATGCDLAHAAQEIRAPYQADYLFYAPK